MGYVLFHRPTVWSSEIQCSTKVLARLTAARGHRVDYLQAPLDPVHLLRGPGGYLKVWQNSPTQEAGVRILTPMTPVPVRDAWPLNTLTAARLRYRMARPTLPRTIDAPDLIWTTVPGSGAVLKQLFPRAKTVFHVVDYYPAFRGAAVKPLERDDYQAVDAVYTIGQTLAEYLTDDLEIPADKVRVLGQGVEAERYSSDLPEPAALAGLPHPRVVWTGVLGKGDPGLFGALASDIAARGGSLVLIGPTASWAEDLAARAPDTVHLMGSVPPPELPGWLVHCDIGVMLYDRSKQDVYRGQNPLKLYEYAAAGLPTLSTPHDEYASLAPPAQVVTTEPEIAPYLAGLLEHRAQHQADMLAFAARCSWQAKVDTILNRFLPAPPEAQTG